MKKILFSALVATVAIGGALVSNANASRSVKSKSLAIYTYYLPSENCRTITCDYTFLGPTCSSLYGVTLPTQYISQYECVVYQVVEGNYSLD